MIEQLAHVEESSPKITGNYRLTSNTITTHRLKEALKDTANPLTDYKVQGFQKNGRVEYIITVKLPTSNTWKILCNTRAEDKIFYTPESLTRFMRSVFKVEDYEIQMSAHNPS